MRGQVSPLLDLADGVREALGGLDRTDGDTRASGGEWTEGNHGVPPEVHRLLDAGPVILDGAFGGNRLTAVRNAAVVTVAACAAMAPHTLARGEYERDLPVLLDTIDHALTTP
ncbi:hypothetical protein [Embleya sp. NPDC001921]